MKALIVVDMQNDFVTGSLKNEEAVKIIPNIKKKIEEYKSTGDAVYFTQDTHTEDYLKTLEGIHLPVPHCILGSLGWKVVSELEDEACMHITKNTFGFPDWGDGCLDMGRFDSFELVGVCTDICVISNALLLKALFSKKEVYVDASCCAGSTPERHAAALETMKSCQINVMG